MALGGSTGTKAAPCSVYFLALEWPVGPLHLHCHGRVGGCCAYEGNISREVFRPSTLHCRNSTPPTHIPAAAVARQVWSSSAAAAAAANAAAAPPPISLFESPSVLPCAPPANRSHAGIAWVEGGVILVEVLYRQE